VAVALAAAPSGALAQGAGDDQYTDPFEETTSTPATPRTPNVTPMPQGSRAPARTASPAAPAEAAAPAAAPAGPELADTGLDVRIVLVAGLALMAGGAALRLRLR